MTIFKTMNQDKIKPKKYFGQNFLKNRVALQKILKAADINRNNTVLEIGPGEGILTQQLAQLAGRVVAVEKDRDLIPKLKEDLKNFKNIEIIQADILKFLPNFKAVEYKVVANIPYYLTARLLRLLLEKINPPKQMTLMLQKEVAERICAKPPKMNLLAASVQYFGRPKIILIVNKDSFRPQPQVDSAIINIEGIYPKKEQIIFFKIIRAGFSHPRKIALNNIAQGLNIEKSSVEEIFTKHKINLKARPQNIGVEMWEKFSYDLKKFIV